MKLTIYMLNDAENVESDQVNAGSYVHVNRINARMGQEKIGHLQWVICLYRCLCVCMC